MKTYTIELKKTVVVTVEAESAEGAGEVLRQLEKAGDLDDGWRDAETKPVLIHVGADQ